MVTKTDLPDLVNQTGEFLYCQVCDSRCSAIRGDYFQLPDTYTFRCCGEPMILAREICTIEPVQD